MEAFLYGRAPWLEQRVESARRLLATRYARVRDGEIVDTAEFDRRMLTVVRDNAALDTRAGRFSLAQRQLDRVLAATPRDPIAHLDAGDLQRLQSQRAGSVAERRAYLAKAVESYERAAELDLTYAAPFRQLGLLYYQQSDVARAREAFQKYLALEPAASDAQRIGEYLAELGRRP
jgi:tetratricopeptide (TPR) repeat protein